MSRTAADTTGTPAPEAAAATTTRRPRARLLGLVAALLLGLLAPLAINASPASAAPAHHSRTHYEYRVAKYVQRMINRERAAHHRSWLYLNTHLMSSARSHNYTMARYNEMSHQLPGEAFFGTRMDRAGYHWMNAGENIAWNSSYTFAAAGQVQNLMYHEVAPNDGHRVNILNRHFKNVGVDIYIDRAHHKLWLTTDFGQR